MESTGTIQSFPFEWASIKTFVGSLELCGAKLGLVQKLLHLGSDPWLFLCCQSPHSRSQAQQEQRHVVPLLHVTLPLCIPGFCLRQEFLQQAVDALPLWPERPGRSGAALFLHLLLIVRLDEQLVHVAFRLLCLQLVKPRHGPGQRRAAMMTLRILLQKRGLRGRAWRS